MIRLWLIIHHCAAHPLMAFLPRAWGDALHDWTATFAFPEACEECAGQGVIVANDPEDDADCSACDATGHSSCEERGSK